MLESTEDKFNWTERIIDECQIEYPVHKVIQGKRSTCVDVGANVGGFMTVNSLYGENGDQKGHDTERRIWRHH